MNKDLYLDVLKHQVLPFMTENNIVIYVKQWPLSYLQANKGVAGSAKFFNHEMAAL